MATNTEKPTGKKEMKKNVAPAPSNKVDNKEMLKAPIHKKSEEKAEAKKTETQDMNEVKSSEKTEQKSGDKKTETKKTQVKKVAKDFAVINANNVRVSTKYAVAICRFIKNKKIGDAMRDLGDVIVRKKHIPMIGEYGHKKGNGKFASGAGKYPVNASREFISLLKGLAGNAIANEINEPVITECVANQASRPMGRFGRWERKRTHVKLVARESKQNKKSKVRGNK